MSVRSRAFARSGRILGVIFMTLSMMHTPLPQPDFHNIRHHDEPGEVCEFHDHLLRWHPGAGVAGDVAVLHWHWFLPSEPDSENILAKTFPALHAHSPDWQTATWETSPQLSPTNSSVSQLLPRPVSSPLDFLNTPSGQAVLAGGQALGMHPRLAFSATFAPGISLSVLHQRWDC